MRPTICNGCGLTIGDGVGMVRFGSEATLAYWAQMTDEKLDFCKVCLTKMQEGRPLFIGSLDH